MDDLRIPIGAFFLILGGVLVAMPLRRSPLTDAPVNLYAGMVMLVFGGVMVWLAFRKS
ncbi:MAG TPA: hypothetical protein VK419_02035 [Bryobacteraceae bacterium]|nr:hypothetical protein [Bryobacteraceae bacterium]